MAGATNKLNKADDVQAVGQPDSICESGEITVRFGGLNGCELIKNNESDMICPFHLLYCDCNEGAVISQDKNNIINEKNGGFAMKKMMGIILIAAMAMSLCACDVDDFTDQMADVVQADDEHVLAVKNAAPHAYPDKEFGETFENFFASPTWKYFLGTKEGPDEDGDGKADYTEENVDIVEFTGYCKYRDVRVKALIQFTLSKDDDTFEATYLSFNDVPQNMFILSELLETAFTNGAASEDQ